jgi:hypothetical protein
MENEKEENKTFSISPERLENETFEEYKKRRKLVNKAIKNHKKGYIHYPSILYIPKTTKNENGTDEVQYDEKGNIIYNVVVNKPYIKNKEK